MKRKAKLEPLVHLILGTLGLAPAVSCGGASESHSAGGTGGSGHSVEIGTCEGAMPFGASGWERCDTGVTHRASVGSCPAPPPMTPACGTCPASGQPWCLPVGMGTLCVAGCTTDSDCAAGEVCFCEGEQAGRCLPADCTTDADCGEGSLCAAYLGPPEKTCGYYTAGVACQKPDDQCLGHECICALKNDHRECQEGLGGCGRPFLVEGRERVAPARERSDWASGTAPERLTLGGAERAALAAYWSDVGLMEHASIAAFARFTLELVALGAPADLVSASARAMADETRHTELAFAFASAYAGEAVGPGELAVDGCLVRPTLEGVLRTVLLEGAVGETVAAAEARELAARVADPAVRDVLATIADDEGRHATLAYRFVKWALSRDRSLVTRVVAEVLREVRRNAKNAQPHAGETDLSPFGLPTAAWRGALRADVVEGVVVPCLQALVDSGPPADERLPGRAA